MTLSNAIQVYPDPVVRQRFLQHVGADTIFYPNLRLKALAEREQIDFMDLAQPMQVYADQNKVFLHGFGAADWNATGTVGGGSELKCFGMRPVIRWLPPKLKLSAQRNFVALSSALPPEARPSLI